jgi:predicted  nucleic acid-binding Zn-ribbon protein
MSMNAERAKRREEIAAGMMAALNGPMGPGEGYSDYGAMARDAVRMANALMDELDVAALADTPDADPVHQTAAMQDLQAAKDAAANRSVSKSILIWQRDRQIAELEEQLAALKQRAKGGDDRDIVIEANAIQIAALNGIVQVREDQLADLERKVAALNEFVEDVRAEAHEDPELYGPFVRLVRDLDAKVGVK